jgi:MFS superfamily sulfate permease-like transporter
VIPLAALAFVFLLFPTGRLRSRRWRPAAWFVGGASVFAAVVLLVLAYAIVTGVLVGVYAGLVLLATQVFDIRSPIAVAGSTLAAAALFSPLRERVQRAVDRRFNRSRYDADQIVAAFAVHLKDAVDLDSVRDDLAGVVSRALEPAHVSVWVNQRD